MSKQQLVTRLIAQLRAEVDMLTKAALATHAEATDDENKAEDKYDTRGLEASYLAHGQSKAAEEAALALAQFSALTLRDFGPGEPIGLGALISLDARGQLTHYFIGPRAGGTEVDHDGRTIMVITPQSPLGRQLVGKRQGDTLQLEIGGRQSSYQLSSVS